MAVGFAYFVGVGMLGLLGTGVGVAADETVPMAFTNFTDGVTELFWLDTDKGKEVSYGYVPKGKSKTLETFKGHVWIVRSAEGEELGRYTVKTTPGSAATFALSGSQADLVRRNTRPTDPGAAVPGTQPMTPGTQPATQPTMPGTQPTMPGTQPANQPATQPTTPGTQPMTPGTQPATQPTMPGTQPARPQGGVGNSRESADPGASTPSANQKQEEDKAIPPRQVPAGQDLAAVKAEMIRLTNAERAKLKLEPLVEDARLSSAAQKQTDRMAQQQKLILDLGTDTGQRVTAEGFNWSGVAEISYRAGQKEAADAAKPIQTWMSSTGGQREFLLSTTYTHIGVGVAYSATGAPYCTLVFAKPVP
jgi:uncharacterized protein YkwD